MKVVAKEDDLVFPVVGRKVLLSVDETVVWSAHSKVDEKDSWTVGQLAEVMAVRTVCFLVGRKAGKKVE